PAGGRRYPGCRPSRGSRGWRSCSRSGPRGCGPARTSAALAVALLLAAAPLVFTSYGVGLVTQMMIFAILAMSLGILLGYTGLPSLGHAGIFGAATYTVAVLSTSYHAGFWTSVAG